MILKKTTVAYINRGAILKSMSILATASAAKPARTTEAKRIAWLYAGLLAVMAICQLLSFSHFVLVIDSYWLPGGLQFAAFLAGSLIAAELLSIPFLLRLQLSPAFRIFGMGLSWLVPLTWLFLTLRIFVTTNELSNVGFLGGLVSLVPGWWAVFVSSALAILAVWATWGLWPLRSAAKRKKK
jgi:hypothetical protein